METATSLNHSKILFSKPFLTGREMVYLRESLESQQWAGDGLFTERCSKILERLVGCPVLLTPSGTHALELAFMTLDLQPGDEVILPSYTFVSTANCLVLHGLKPVFVDIRDDTLNLDEKLIEQAITGRTRAILPVHYSGVGCDMETIQSIAHKYRLFVVEDAAQALNAFYADHPLGSFGDFGAFSFHQTKNWTCGEGGALVIANRDYLQKAKIRRQKGTNRELFFQGGVDKYSWVDKGSSYLMSDLLAAFLLAQLESISEVTTYREKAFKYYWDCLSPFAQDRFRLPFIPRKCRTNYHLFYLLTEDMETRDKLQSHLQQKGIEAITHFEPLHSSEAGKRFGVVRGSMSVTEETANCLLRLPLYPQISQQEQEVVIKGVESFYQ